MAQVEANLLCVAVTLELLGQRRPVVQRFALGFDDADAEAEPAGAQATDEPDGGEPAAEDQDRSDGRTGCDVCFSRVGSMRAQR